MKEVFMPKWAIRFLIELLKLVVSILEDLVNTGNGDFVDGSEDHVRGIVARRLAESGPGVLSVYVKSGGKPADDKKSASVTGA
jgi:hypothetical protein